jgi:hypothetical protein
MLTVKNEHSGRGGLKWNCDQRGTKKKEMEMYGWIRRPQNKKRETHFATYTN